MSRYIVLLLCISMATTQRNGNMVKSGECDNNFKFIFIINQLVWLVKKNKNFMMFPIRGKLFFYKVQKINFFTISFFIFFGILLNI